MKDKLTYNQQKLLDFLKSRKSRWTYCKDIAFLVYGETFDDKSFLGSGIQRTIARDIHAINNSSIKYSILFNRSKGIKLACKEDLSIATKAVKEAENRLNLARKIQNKLLIQYYGG